MAWNGVAGGGGHERPGTTHSYQHSARMAWCPFSQNLSLEKPVIAEQGTDMEGIFYRRQAVRSALTCLALCDVSSEVTTEAQSRPRVATKAAVMPGGGVGPSLALFCCQ